MIFLPGVMAALVISAHECAKAELKLFEESLIGLTEEEANKRRLERKEELKERERKNTEERRHRDICDAIESTSFWNFGSSNRSRF